MVQNSPDIQVSGLFLARRTIQASRHMYRSAPLVNEEMYERLLDLLSIWYLIFSEKHI